MMSLITDTTLGISEKQRRIPAMVMWYLPVADRLRRFFSNPKAAELMCWWDSNKHTKGDGRLRHPDVRFALSTDGMNLFGERTSTHSIWQVILTMYNLPTWLC